MDFSLETLNSSALKAIFLAIFSADNNSESVDFTDFAAGQKTNNNSPKRISNVKIIRENSNVLNQATFSSASKLY